MANIDIKQTIKASGFSFWQVAEQYGCADTTFSRKLRHELSAVEKKKIHQAIKELSSELPSARKVKNPRRGKLEEGA